MKASFEYENRIIEFNIMRSKRKTLGIKIDENCEITVSAPLRISKEIIIKSVQNKASWIVKKQDEISKRKIEKIERKAIEGSTFMYLGMEYPLHLVFDKMRRNITVELNNVDFNKFIIHTNTEDEKEIKLALEKWYRTRTMEIVKERIEYHSNEFKEKVSNIKVKEQKRRWASCTGKNEILFNWRISMAKFDVIDYIVVHEMCHMDFRNHSKDFWNRVKEIMPDYKEKHEWLKINGINLYI